MLVRRMLLFFALLLLVTAFTAALAPPRRLPPPPPAASPAPATRSVTVERVLDAGRERPRTITVRAGDLLRLEVRSPTADAVELEGLAALRPVAPDTPVVFDVLPDVAGEYPVVLVDAERTVGTVRVVTQPE